MCKSTFQRSSVSKKGKRRLFFVFITFCLIILCTGDSLLLAQNDLTKVRINLVNFLYIIDAGYERQKNTGLEIERAVLFPGIEKTLSGYGISNYGIQYDRVSSGNIDYNGLNLPADSEETPQNQLVIWGMVKPVNWPDSYNLDLQFYYNSNPIYQARLEVRKKTILSWDNQKCRLPLESISFLAASVAFKLAGRMNGEKPALSDSEIDDKISESLNSSAYDLPASAKSFLQSWLPGKSGETATAEAALTLVLDRGASYRLHLDQKNEAAIKRFLTTNKTMNWYLEQGSLLMPEITFTTEKTGRADLEVPAEQTRRPAQLSIGVIPFRNGSEQDDSDWLGFGLAYLLNNKFSQISAYKLADENVVQKFINSDSATIEVNGLTWSLDYTIGGAYRLEDDNLDVDISITQAFAGVRIASERYTRSFDEFFNIVDQAADKFLTLTDINLTGEEQKRFRRRVTNSMKAFEYFCLGYIENSKSVKNEDEIIRYFKEAISLDPEFWGAYYNLGTAYFNSDDYAAALVQFNTIIDHFPSFELAYFGRGVTYLRQQYFQQAQSDLQLYLEQRPDDFRAYFYLGRCAIALKQYGEAVNYLNKAAELYPTSARTFFELGNAYFASNRFRRAIYHYNQAVRLDPDYLEAHKRLGESHYRMHNFNGSIDEFNFVLTRQPQDPESNFMLGVTVYKQALLDEYIDAFLEMYGLLKPDEIEANHLKYNGQKAHIYEEMVRRFYLAQSFRNNFYEATFNLALTYQEMGKPDSALYYYKKTLRINPKLAKARLVLAKFYENQGDYDQALEQYKQSVRIDPSFFIGYPRLGKDFDEIDVLATVTEELEREIRGDPHNIEASLSLANIFFAQGYQGKAAVLYRKVLSIQPKQKTARQMLARIGG